MRLDYVSTCLLFLLFFFNDTATSEIYTLSLHDALPISLRCSLFCGEPLPAAYAQSWQEAAPNSIVENLYGPTEATIAIAHYRWDSKRSSGECVNGIVPIGRIFEGQQFRVTDSQGEKAPIGESGELCLSGSQVTNSYWNNPAKTQMQFVRLTGASEQVWYRTGDLTKQYETGNL